MPNKQLNKLKSEIKNGNEVTFFWCCKISSNVIGNSNDENTFAHKLLLTNTQVLRLCRTFTNNSSASRKLSKT